MRGDTGLMRMVIEDLAELKGWTYEQAMDAFYASGTCRALSDRETGVFTYSPIVIIEMFEEGFIYPPG